MIRWLDVSTPRFLDFLDDSTLRFLDASALPSLSLLAPQNPLYALILPLLSPELLVLAAVTVLCLMPIEDPPLQDVPFIDKWTHMALFGGICVVMLVDMTLGQRLRTRWAAPILSALYGGAIELMQAYFTTCRSGEWLDFYADAFGALVAFPIGLAICRWLARFSTNPHTPASPQ